MLYFKKVHGNKGNTYTRIDLLGKRFGAWVGVSKGPSTFWLCQCDCGKVRQVAGTSLRGGLSKSCGCKKSELIGEKFLKHGHTLNRVASKTYSSWAAMHQRCGNVNTAQYADYG